MVTITGGKLTTWRRMAKMTVDRIVEREGRDAPCRTHQVPLGMPVDAAALPRVPGVAEAAYAARNEQALTVGDVLLRRTRLALTAARDVCAPDGAAPRAVAAVLAGELGWDAGRTEREAAAFRAEAAAEGVVVY